MKRTLATLLTLACLTLATHATDTSLLFGTWQRTPRTVGHLLFGYAALVYYDEPSPGQDTFELVFTSGIYTNEVARLSGDAFLVKETLNTTRFTFFPDGAGQSFSLYYDKRDRSFRATVQFPPVGVSKGYSRKIRGFLMPPELVPQ
jgi:hypothetical protein